jgi:hypothetical protein
MEHIVYQVLHPWHWLTYGQNAAAVAALAAVVGFIVLFFYTLYTRRMMRTQSRTMEIQAQAMDIQVQTMEMQRRILQMQESAASATIIPKLVARGDVEFVSMELEHNEATDIGLQQPRVTLYSAVLNIRNVGAGAALFLKGWNQPVSGQFCTDNSDILANTNQVSEVWAQLTELMTGECTSITFQGFKPEDLHRAWIFVIDTIDQTNRKHQLQLLRTPRAHGNTDVSVSMHHQK